MIGLNAKQPTVVRPYHLSDRALPILILIAGFVVNGAGEAVERLRAGERTAVEPERHCGRVWTAGDGYLGVKLQRLGWRERADDHRWRGWRSGRRSVLASGQRGGPDRGRSDEPEHTRSDDLARIGAPQRGRPRGNVAQGRLWPGEGQSIRHVGDIAS